MEKENLILVHSFPTNSRLLSGLVEYLDDYFNVYFVDLPGFMRNVPPLSKITLEGYYEFFADKIAAFDLDSYLVGGMSFGFMVVNHVKYDHRCKGILAMAPFMGPESLRMGLLKKVLYNAFIKGVCFFNLSYPVWKSNLLKTYLPRLRNYPPGSIDIMLEEIDGKTFFETANLLLTDKSKPSFQDFPHVLIANKDDRSVNFEYLHRVLSENVERLLVVHTTMEHYPQTPTKDYFQAQFPEEKVRAILDFLSLE